MKYGTANVCQDNFVKIRRKKNTSLTQWMWFRRDEEGNASEKYYELFRGRENNYFCQ